MRVALVHVFIYLRFKIEDGFLKNDFLVSSLDSCHSLPSSYKLLVPARECTSELFMNCVRPNKTLSPLLLPFAENRNWEQYPSSESNLPRHRRDLVKEIPTSVLNDSLNESNTLRA